MPARKQTRDGQAYLAFLAENDPADLFVLAVPVIAMNSYKGIRNTSPSLL